jgi:hypothetical protein
MFDKVVIAASRKPLRRALFMACRIERVTDLAVVLYTESQYDGHAAASNSTTGEYRASTSTSVSTQSGALLASQP